MGGEGRGRGRGEGRGSGERGLRERAGGERGWKSGRLLLQREHRYMPSPRCPVRSLPTGRNIPRPSFSHLGSVRGDGGRMAASTVRRPAEVAGRLRKATQGPAGGSVGSVVPDTNQVQVQSTGQGAYGRQPSFLSPSSLSLSLPFSLTINKNLSEGEHKKKAARKQEAG